MKKQYKIENINNFSELRKIQMVLENNIHYVDYKINIDTSVLTINFREDEDKDLIIEKIKNLISTSVKDAIIVEKESKNLQRRVLVLNNLDCANCAAKIERLAKKELDHEVITVDFATQKFIIETTNEELIDNLDNEVTRISHMVDDKIIVSKVNQRKKADKDISFKIDKRRKLKFIIGCSIFLVGFIFKTIWHLYTGTDATTHPWYVALVIYVTYIPGYVLLGGDVLLGALKNLKSGRIFDEKFLMSIATIAALAINYYDEAILVMAFYKLGELCQQYAVNYSRKSIAALTDIQAEVATIEVENELIEIDPTEVVRGDILIVKSGEKIALDGVVIEGESFVDTSALTGESLEQQVNVGDKVLSGSINKGSILKIIVNKEYNDSMVSKILNLVDNASSLKSKSENFISKFAKYYTPIVVIIAVIIAIVLPFIRGNVTLLGFQDSIYSALILLVVSCPCALVISIPLGFFGGIGGASKQGILIKGSNYLEELYNVDTIVFDKTGTLTKGQFKVEKIIPNDNVTEEELLKYCAYAEVMSAHPIAKSIIEAYGKRIDMSQVKTSDQSTGVGVITYINDKEVIVGRKDLFKRKNIDIPEATINGLIVYCAVDKKYAGYIVINDEIKDGVIDTIKELKNFPNIKKLVMFTGDNEITAKKVAEEIGIYEVYSNMSPIDKVNKLRRLRVKQAPNKRIAFVGDGINDAPVISSADVGIAMGGLGSAAAIEVADVVLMTDEISKIITALKVARKTRAIVMENIIFALTIKMIVLILAPFNILNYLIIEAIFADVGVSLVAIMNSLRAMRKVK